MERNDLLLNLEKIHTTELGVERIRRNIDLEVSDVIEWCKSKIQSSNDIVRKGKNWYVTIDGIVLTVNANSFTIITAHKKKKKRKFPKERRNIMKFALVTLYVKDMEKSLEFYNTLLEIPIIRRQTIAPDHELVFMGIKGEANLELIPTNEDISYSGFSIGFEVKDLSAIKERLSDSGYTIKREFSPVPTTTLCFLDGPNGEEVELIEYR